MATKEEKKRKKIEKDNAKRKAIKNKKAAEQNAVSTSKVPTFKDPSQTLWGKIVIGILILGMGGIVIIGLIFAIINAS
jgi:type IV secretory pathway VirB6-like protein